MPNKIFAVLLTTLIANNATHPTNGMISKEFAALKLILPANNACSELAFGTKFKTTAATSVKLAAVDVLEQANGTISKMYVA